MNEEHIRQYLKDSVTVDTASMAIEHIDKLIEFQQWQAEEPGVHRPWQVHTVKLMTSDQDNQDGVCSPRHGQCGTKLGR